ncbi:GUN4 domain-containing protein [Spirulina subsalsa FACHB-351]|uniref:GUN4 domain-containing protein n=1 Tax=Spirulina subsalsa FACHB-351 TaxID=234711 RepID=A0ABT3L1H2_9CYAN|nr:GUN4 domain-containing protein [Spirulina subsalsa]MCW6035346.1 GUN4 domain-containing protein [Spirulina subsalsa FACHB-351]
MAYCPICQTEYTPNEDEICVTCGWDLIPRSPRMTAGEYHRREERRLMWARQMWMTLQVHSPLITLLRDMQEQLSKGSDERQELNGLLHQLQAQLTPEVAASVNGNSAPLRLENEPLPDVVTPRERLGNYRTLERLLQQKQWREADQETARLMIAIAQREKQNYLTQADLAVFPCQELLVLDQLWQVASQGKFGLMIQKQLYLELGGTRFLQPSIWRTMGQKVGWVQGNGWLTYDRLTFSLEAPVGHLPVLGDGLVWFVGGWDGGNQGFSALVSRLVQCRV